MHKAWYTFTRSDGVAGFSSTNRASSDALNALEQWKSSGSGRTYKKVEDLDESLTAELSFNESDTSSGLDLEAISEKLGVERTYVPLK